MSDPRFPSELLDSIVDHLHDTRRALERCCLVSRSWVPRTRKHLFANVTFHTATGLQSWKNAFPNPSTSPACYTKNLVIRCPEEVTAADAEEHGWIPAFSRVVHFDLEVHDGPEASLTPFHGFSPVLKSLHVSYITLSSSRVLDLLHSFPLLEDFAVTAWDTPLIENADRQPTIVQPPLTGTLRLGALEGMSPIISQLLSPLGGLRFRKLELSLHREEDISSISALVGCCLTLESLRVNFGICDEPVPGFIDLSKAIGLKDASIEWASDLQWVVLTLRTITHNHRNLQRISLKASCESYIRFIDKGDPADLRDEIGRTLYQGWLELDEVLVQLWESHSIRSEVVYDTRRGIRARRAARRLESLLSGAVERGIVHLVERCTELPLELLGDGELV